MTSFTSEQVKQTQDIAELECRRYFDVYLREILPDQLATLEARNAARVETHNTDPDSHNGTPRRVERALWTIAGVCLAGGAGLGGMGIVVAKALGVPLP